MSEKDLSFCEMMTIKNDHPSLAGHFPDNPIVPGVVILDNVIRLWQTKKNKQINRINNTKFIKILRAGVQGEIQYTEIKETKKINFIIYDEEKNTIAKGQFTYA